jgi:alpha/beta superfamily hydrolase
MKRLLAGLLSLMVLVAHSFGGLIARAYAQAHPEAVQALNAHPGKLNVPVTVLSRGLPYTTIRQAKMSYDDVDAFNTTGDAAQFELATISNDMRHVRMRYTNHMFDEQDPWLVLDELGLLLKRVEAQARP